MYKLFPLSFYPSNTHSLSLSFSLSLSVSLFLSLTLSLSLFFSHSLSLFSLTHSLSFSISLFLSFSLSLSLSFSISLFLSFSHSIYFFLFCCSFIEEDVQNILLTKTTAVRNAAALSYRRMRGLCFLAVVFVAQLSNAAIATIIYNIATNVRLNKKARSRQRVHIIPQSNLHNVHCTMYIIHCKL